MNLSIEYFDTKQLTPYALNSRTHSERQVSQIAASIEEFGFTNPVLVDERGGIVAGHGRVLAAKALGLNEVPAIVLKNLTPSQKKAYVIADNKLALNAGWNDANLKLEIESLELDGFNVDLLGFDVIPEFEKEIDYSILDETLDSQVEKIATDVKRAIQIEFDEADYESATRLIKKLRQEGQYIGAIVLDALAAFEQ
jgi:ParB-like chromosome segregation protein Spo0J